MFCSWQQGAIIMHSGLQHKLSLHEAVQNPAWEPWQFFCQSNTRSKNGKLFLAVLSCCMQTSIFFTSPLPLYRCLPVTFRLSFILSNLIRDLASGQNYKYLYQFFIGIVGHRVESYFPFQRSITSFSWHISRIYLTDDFSRVWNEKWIDTKSMKFSFLFPADWNIYWLVELHKSRDFFEK